MNHENRHPVVEKGHERKRRVSRSVRIERLLTPAKIGRREIASQAALVLLFYTLLIAFEILVLGVLARVLPALGW
jgi:hypothetical protein